MDLKKWAGAHKWFVLLGAFVVLSAGVLMLMGSLTLRLSSKSISRMDCTTKTIWGKGVGLCANDKTNLTYIFWAEPDLETVKVGNYPWQTVSRDGHILIAWGFPGCGPVEVYGPHGLKGRLPLADPTEVEYIVMETAFATITEGSSETRVMVNLKTGKRTNIWSLPSSTLGVCDFR